MATTKTLSQIFSENPAGELMGDEILELSKPDGSGGFDSVGGLLSAIAAFCAPQLLAKTNRFSPAWETDGSGVVTSQAVAAVVGSVLVRWPAGVSVELPTLAAGTDYAVYGTTDGRLVASDNFSAPAGEPAGSTRKLGGFHVALSGEILNYSLWDEAYRPVCEDPRGMVCVNGKLWADIYLTGVNHHTDGTSAAGATIADGSAPPKIPAIYGGDGSVDYGSYTWFEACDVLQSHAKRLPSWAEFSLLAFGVTEGTDVGSDPGTTQHQPGHRSMWGVEQATGVLYQWGADVSGTTATGTAAWQDIAEGRGQVYTHSVRAVRLGGYWSNGSNAGSRCAAWNVEPSSSHSSIGSRGVCDHLTL